MWTGVGEVGCKHGVGKMVETCVTVREVGVVGICRGGVSVSLAKKGVEHTRRRECRAGGGEVGDVAGRGGEVEGSMRTAGNAGERGRGSMRYGVCGGHGVGWGCGVANVGRNVQGERGGGV
jgi:hypothetical protein